MEILEVYNLSNKLFQSFRDPKYKQKDESKYRIWWYSRNSSKTKVSYQQPQLQRYRWFFKVSIKTNIIIRFYGIEFIINPRINGEALPLSGSCKIHGNSKESITHDMMTKVWYFKFWNKNNFQISVHVSVGPQELDVSPATFVRRFTRLWMGYCS